MSKEKILLKDFLFNTEKITKISHEICSVYKSFDSNAFIFEVVEKFPELELKERIKHIRNCLKKYLPQEYSAALGIIISSLPQPLDESNTDGNFGDFIYAAYGDFVAHFGLSKENLQVSLDALYEITKRFSCEDAIRLFLIHHQKETLAVINTWSQDYNYHVRRLCSEGTRPLLPWSQRVSLDPKDILPILEKLSFDPTRYVLRSVANHLNDLSKMYPELVIEKLTQWSHCTQYSKSNFDFLKKHSLRSLRKKAHPKALKLLGYEQNLLLSIQDSSFLKQLSIDEYQEFSFVLKSESNAEILLDYVIVAPDVKGGIGKGKVYSLKTVKVSKGVTYFFTKKFRFRAAMTTRKWYPGNYTITIRGNGIDLSSFSFELLA